MSFRNLLYVFLLVSLVAMPSAAAPRHHHEFGALRGMTSEQRINQAVTSLQGALNLSPTQTDKVRQLARTRWETFQSIRDQARPKHEQLMSLLKQAKPDPEAVGRATIELKAIHDQAVAKQANLEKQFMSILNPSQQQIVNNVRSQAPTFMALRRLGFLGTTDHPTTMSSLFGD